MYCYKDVTHYLRDKSQLHVQVRIPDRYEHFKVKSSTKYLQAKCHELRLRSASCTMMIFKYAPTKST